ncbi:MULTISPECIES: hypothetical protein [Moorena]|uniref:Uncharacterized protein n=1 Tax=Moorena producens 3L TaxID=489825 RepID=F4XJT0_9CYAN|nr:MULTISPECIES: hypothetical protein [Moorena]EGJ35360.1 hypothetical protein LYNGBM3L_08280 [Moorena producens 3L]NEP63972.1 hypothetical protein [Moorena sp. SIO3A5]OLT65610.1 hypothetical protein BI334_11720 [Moorena producens 3L]
MQNYKQDQKLVNPENPPRSLVKNFLWMGIGIATLFITGKGAIFGYQQWLSHQEQLFVETMEDLIINKDFVECMNKALEIPESSHQSYNARAFLNQCAQGQLDQAEKVVKSQELKPVDENYKLAINLAKKIPSSTSVYNQAQDAILKWEKKWRKLVGVEGFTDGIYFYQQNKGSNLYLIFQKQGNKILGKKYGFQSDYIVCLRGVIRRDILKDLTGISYGIDFIPQVESVDPINLSKWYRISWDKISNSSKYPLHYAYNNKDHHIESCQKEFDKNP